MPKQTITVTFELETTDQTDRANVTGEALATYLSGLLRESDTREGVDQFRLSDPTVFTGPVPVVVDGTGGGYAAAYAPIPVDLAIFDTDNEVSSDNVFNVPNGADTVETWIGGCRVEPLDAFATAVLAARDGPTITGQTLAQMYAEYEDERLRTVM